MNAFEKIVIEGGLRTALENSKPSEIMRVLVTVTRERKDLPRDVSKLIELAAEKLEDEGH